MTNYLKWHIFWSARINSWFGIQSCEMKDLDQGTMSFWFITTGFWLRLRETNIKILLATTMLQYCMQGKSGSRPMVKSFLRFIFIQDKKIVWWVIGPMNMMGDYAMRSWKVMVYSIAATGHFLYQVIGWNHEELRWNKIENCYNNSNLLQWCDNFNGVPVLIRVV